MSDASYSILLCNLSCDYYHNHIGFEEYRARRRIILDKVDQEMNGADPKDTSREDAGLASAFMRTVGFHKNIDPEKQDR